MFLTPQDQQQTGTLIYCYLRHLPPPISIVSWMQVSTFCQTLNPHQSLGSSLQNKSGKQCALECTMKSSVPVPANPFSLPPLALQLCCHLPVAPQPQGPGHSRGSQLMRVKGRSTEIRENRLDPTKCPNFQHA